MSRLLNDFLENMDDYNKEDDLVEELALLLDEAKEAEDLEDLETAYELVKMAKEQESHLGRNLAIGGGGVGAATLAAQLFPQVRAVERLPYDYFKNRGAAPDKQAWKSGSMWQHIKDTYGSTRKAQLAKKLAKYQKLIEKITKKMA
jgi:hypothetical protein